MKKRILLLHFSQSGQLSGVVRSISEPLRASPDITLTCETLRPLEPFPFPWPFFTFFDTFPETVYLQPGLIEPLASAGEDFDLIILAYQVWFLSPAQPVTAFLQSEDARALLRDKPVVTVIACRNMWLMAQETMKTQLADLSAHLVDNVVLTDEAGTGASFFATPLWLLTGNKGPFLGGLIPAAGVSPDRIRAASRFGEAIAAQLPQRQARDWRPMLTGMGAVSINENLIASERIALRSFRIWGGLLRTLGRPGNPLRRALLLVYVLFLVTMIATVVPITSALKRLLAPLMRGRIEEQRRYYAAPSGEYISQGCTAK